MDVEVGGFSEFLGAIKKGSFGSTRINEPNFSIFLPLLVITTLRLYGCWDWRVSGVSGGYKKVIIKNGDLRTKFCCELLKHLVLT
jgi:hypothetical protein